MNANYGPSLFHPVTRPNNLLTTKLTKGRNAAISTVCTISQKIYPDGTDRTT
ncbi:hypothetical protein OHD16_17930 [Sphingobacterium sp. ML3W]|uniref:hypothetical protein n=1 Tax=Sphingobacterium sp. ML3W TaxID=1538644 RepID=UPI00249CF0D7|nr:hypothetical protein [Sphingobacterium sp. ML3W]WFA81837.1 hypothetical protein OGI71_11070 [Sphingobacterium sp. ML3W]